MVREKLEGPKTKKMAEQYEIDKGRKGIIKRMLTSLKRSSFKINIGEQQKYLPDAYETTVALRELNVPEDEINRAVQSGVNKGRKLLKDEKN